MTFEKLDLMMGSHAPFLISLADGVCEELRIVISPAGIGREPLVMEISNVKDE